VRTTLHRAASIIAIGSLLAACSSGSSGSPNAGGQSVAATEKEWQISLANSTFQSGEVTFNIKNDGDKEHEFVIRKTDLQSDNLPLNDAGEVEEDNEQLSEAGDPSEVGSVMPGTTETLTLTLEPGHYVIFCNIHDQDLLHYQKGMHTDFTVS
jgi:uncharacterized cupredoxin-like copper-binding protein